MRSGGLALALLTLIPMAAQAADAHGALAAEQQRIESADYRLNGHLVRVDANGKRTSYAINIKAHGFPGVLRVLLAVDSPAEARAHVLLEMRPGGKNAIQIAHPGKAGTTALPFDKWTEGPLGDGFSYEDFLESPYFWARQTELGAARFGARDCDQVKSRPGAADETHYANVTSWLDHSSGFPVYVEKTLKGSGLVKEFTYFGLRQTDGVWSASQVEVKIRGRAGTTLLIIDRGTAKAHLNVQDFSPAQLMHF